MPSQVRARRRTTTASAATRPPRTETRSGSPWVPNYFNQLANVTTGAAGTTPAYATPGALATMRRLHGIPAYSAAHWSDGDRVTLLERHGSALHWVEVSGGATGTLARPATEQGDRALLQPQGKNVVYVSANAIVDGRLDTGPADLSRFPSEPRRRGGQAAARRLRTRRHRVLPGLLARRQVRGLHPGARRRAAYSNPRGRGLPAAVQRRHGRHRRSDCRPTTRPPAS